MSPRLALAATAAAAALATGVAPALADPGSAAQSQSQSSAQSAAQAQSEAQPAKTSKAKPVKATPAEREAADRLEPLQRATFWMREVDVDPKDAEAGVKLSKALRQLSRTEESTTAAERVLVFHPNDVEGLLELARDHIQAGQPFYALEPLKQAQTAAPKDWRPHSLIGVAYDQLGRTDDARAAWRQALAVSPDNPAVLSNLAMSLAAAGEAAKAETLLRKAVQSPQAGVVTRQDLAMVLGMQGKTAEAEKLIRDDVPPPQADADLAWFRTAPAPEKADPHTWSSLETPAGGK
jgi:Flp pilus assembly protein TadD